MRIHDYARSGDVDGVRRELARGARVDARDRQDFTPLACAAGSPDAGEEVLRLLIDAGADVNAAVNQSHDVPLALAAASGDLDKVKLLVSAGADVHWEATRGYGALLRAACSLEQEDRIIPILEFLIARGADINRRTANGGSPVTSASFAGRFKVLKYLLDAGGDPAPLAWTELMMAVAVGSVRDVAKLARKVNLLAARDHFHRTPWLLAACVGNVDKARLLHAAGADLEERGRMGTTALWYCALHDRAPLLGWLLDMGADVEAADEMDQTPLMLAAERGATACVARLLQAGADVHRQRGFYESAISLASNVETIRLLVRAGADLTDCSTEMKRELTGLSGGEKLDVTRAEYHDGKRPRFGRNNPQVMEIPFWREMIRAGVCAYEARSQFGDTEEIAQPVWCFSRFGSSFTELPDGRFVQIGGEHEDFYHTDFCIYNDVVVYERPGEFQILSYPREVFPPTDFHTATYANGAIYIVGGLRYHRQREFCTTPIYRLDCRKWKIESVASTGENPGWIHRHRARLIEPGVLEVSGGEICIEEDGQEQHLENADRFRLRLATMTWTRS